MLWVRKIYILYPWPRPVAPARGPRPDGEGTGWRWEVFRGYSFKFT